MRRSPMILAAGLAVAAPAAAQQRQGPPEPLIRFETVEQLDAELRALAAADSFAGVVLATRGGDVVHHAAYGLADREAGRAADTATRYNYGSLGKTMTAVLVLGLAQEGLLALEDTLGAFLPGFEPAAARGATIRQLLRHEAGLGDYLGDPELAAEPARFRTVEDFMTLVRGRTLLFAPGAERRYSNSGYVVLGAVVEAATGRSYGDVLRERVIDPAGMARTGLVGIAADANTAVPYSKRVPGQEGRLARATWRLPGAGSPAGGGYATAEDLVRLYRALLDGRLLERRWADVLLNAFEEPAGDVRTGGMGHAGGAPGLNAGVVIEYGPDVVVAVVANRDPMIAVRLAGDVARGLARR